MRPRLLVVDDEYDVREAISDVLTTDYEIVTALTGIDAISKIKDHQVDLVLTDYNMPDMDGLEMLTAIQKISSEIPVVVLSARGNLKVEQEFLKKGAFEYLEKPCNVDVLKSVLKRANNLTKDS